MDEGRFSLLLNARRSPTDFMARASLDLVSRPEPDLAPASGFPLTHAAIGSSFAVVAVDGPAAAELGREGLLPGGLVRVVGRVPLGGPLIVQLGRVRLALGAASAEGIRVVPSSEAAAQLHD
jgi:Fe2+ transport system protein FeoA